MKKSRLILAALTAAATPLSHSIADLYWDTNDSFPGAGDTPNGAWNSSFWSTDPLGETAPVGFWTTGETAVFSAGSDAVNAFSVGVGGSTSAPGAVAGGLVIEEGTVTLTGVLNLNTGPVTIKSGATLSTDSSLRIQASIGSVWTLDGGTLRTTNGSANGSTIDNDATIFLAAGGGTILYNVPNVLNIINFSGTNPVGTTISGPGSLTKAGVGVIAIATACDYLGATIINDGELRVRTSANRLPVTTDVVVNSPGILNLNGVSQKIGSLSGNGDVGTGSGTLTIDGPTDTTFNGAIKNIANAGGGVSTGNGNLIKAGAGVITFTGGNDITGTVTLNAGGITVDPTGSLCGLANLAVNGGALNLNNAGQTIKNLSGTGGTINLGTGHILTTDPVASTTYSGTIAGAGGLRKLNTDATNRALILSGANTYDGITTISAGVIQVGSATALGSTNGYTEVASGGEVRFDGATINFTVNEPFRIAGPGATGGGAITIQNLSTPTLSGPITLTGNATVTVSSVSTGTFNNANAFTSLANESLTLQGGSGAGAGGTISGGIALGTGGLTKLEGGRWILSGANAYTGITNVNAGTLQLNRATADNSAIPTDGVAGNADIVVAGGTLQIAASEQIGNNGGITLNSGTVNFSGSGRTETIGALINNGGTLTTGANTLIGTGGTMTWNGGTNTISNGGVIQDGHVVITGGTNTVAGGATGGVLQINSGGAGLEMTGSTLTLNSNDAVAGKLLLRSGLSTVASATMASITSAFALANKGTIDLDGNTVTVTVADGAAATDLAVSAGIANGGVTKTGAGTLVISGPQSYGRLRVEAGTATLDSSLPNATITDEGGTLNINANADDSIVNANTGTVNIHADQTLNELNIGAAGVVVVAAPPPPAPAESGGFDAVDGGAVISADAMQAVPEPSSLSLLMLGTLGFLLRRQRKNA